MGRFRLTNKGKALIFFVIIALVAGFVFTGVKAGFVKTEATTSKKKSAGIVSLLKKDKKAEKTDTINLSLDEWIGYKTIIDANGGTETAKGSIFDKKGINVNIKIINDADQSSKALIKGSLDAAGYTVNRTAFLSEQFKKADFDVIMPFITNYSNGGDGIIATSDIKSVDDFTGKKIGVPQFSEAQTLVVWFVNQSDLSDKDKKEIISNLILFDTPDDCAKAFFSGELDVAATWEPYLTQATQTTDAHILFSTATSSKLVMSGILFNKDFAEANSDTVQKFIEGVLEASDLYQKNFDTIRDAMPTFATMDDDEILEQTKNAALADYANNVECLNDTAPQIYKDMCDVWESIGEDVDKSAVSSLFDTTYIDSIEGDTTTYSTGVTPQAENAKVTDDNKDSLENTEALLKRSATVNFVPNTCKFMDNKEATKTLDEFIKIAKTLDGSIIQLEGNVASDNTTKAERELSYGRARTVQKYFVANGIDPDRIIVIGNGGDKPVDTNDTSEGCLKNRRTDIMFKCVE